MWHAGPGMQGEVLTGGGSRLPGTGLMMRALAGSGMGRIGVANQGGEVIRLRRSAAENGA